MKVKCQPEDFVVEEVTSLTPVPVGPFGLFRLTKRRQNTMEALKRISMKFNIPRQDIAFCGLKDKHAVTVQYITIAGNLASNYEEESFQVEYLGRSAVAASAASIRANKFKMVLRDLDKKSANYVFRHSSLVKKWGAPNYFDDQRFGSLRGAEDFIARYLINRDYESALKTHLCAPSPFDTKEQKDIERAITVNWGDWAKCKSLLPKCSERSIINYLVDHPQAFKQAYELIDEQMKYLYLSAFQSYLWNRTAVKILEKSLPEGALYQYPISAGVLKFYHALDEKSYASLSQLLVPFVYHRLTLPPGVITDAIKEVLDEEKLVLSEFHTHNMKNYFSRGTSRKLLFRPDDISCSQYEQDEIYKDRVKVTLSLTLQRGSYATVIVKRLTETPPTEEDLLD